MLLSATLTMSIIQWSFPLERNVKIAYGQTEAFVAHLKWHALSVMGNYNNNDRLTAFDPGQPG